jgi:hypothetical protein
MEIATFFPGATEQFCLVPYWLTHHFRIFHHTQPAFANQISVIFWRFRVDQELPSGYQVAFGHFPAAVQ